MLLASGCYRTAPDHDDANPGGGVTDTRAAADTDTRTDTLIETDADTSRDKKTDVDTDTEATPDTGKPTSAVRDTEPDTETHVDTRTDSDTKAETGTASDTGTDTRTELASDTESESAVETGTTVATESASETETDTDPQCIGQPDFTPCDRVTEPDRSYDICIRGTCQSPGCGTTACNAPGPHFPLADSGQRTCYQGSMLLDTCPEEGDEYYGQDAQFGWDVSHSRDERHERSLQTENEPVVTDLVTGLEWQGCAAGLTGDDCTEGDAPPMEWGPALAYCEDLTWGGHDDWRLPDEYELQSILDLGAYDPAVDDTAFPATPSKMFWTSSASIREERVLVVYLQAGQVVEVQKTRDNTHVRCVRGAPTPVSTRYTRDTGVEDEPIVIDNGTGLTWQGCAGGFHGEACDIYVRTGFGAEWEGSLAYCASLEWGGYDDWRMPNVMELNSIMRRSAAPAIDQDAFPATPTHSFWSSTTHVDGSSMVHYGDFETGRTSITTKNYVFYVRCARSGD